MKVAIIYYCYNRIEHTKKSLSKILEFKSDMPLYIFCDGYKVDKEDEVDEVRRFVKKKQKSFSETEIIFRNENLGLAKNVITGVNSVFEKGFDGVIVLEDDCVPYQEFFKYMFDALNKYKNVNEVKHISGFGLPLNFKFTCDNYFTPYPCSWGWATWKAEWVKCNFEDDKYYNEILNTPILKSKFDYSGKSFSHFLKLQLEGEVNSWLVRWYAHIFKYNGLSSWAVNTCVKNTGFDGTGEHRVSYDRFNQNKKIVKENYNFEASYNLNPVVIREFKQHFMGPKLIDKIKTMIYLKTGIILEKTSKKY
ncbi:MAG: hypothetical protein ABJK28_11145 [Algibacter sp.]